MQISNLLGQYNQATAAGAEKVTGTKGVENLVASLKSLTKGNIFEGTVSSVKNGRVTLALSNGTQLSARMDGKVPLSVGQSMFFQVKSNDGTQIAIRPFVVDGSGVNYTLMQALSAAGLPAEPNYLSMVNKMMEEQMPIDRNSLQQMVRLVNANGDIDVQTLVQLSKLGIEITPENAAQFENYLGDRQEIMSAIDSLIEELPAAMQGDGMEELQMRQMDAQVLSIVTEGLDSGDEVVSQQAAGANVPGETIVQTTDNPLLFAAQQQADAAAGEMAAQTATAAGVPAEGVAAADEVMPQEDSQSVQLQESEGASEEVNPKMPADEHRLATDGTANRTDSVEVAPVVKEHTLGAVLDAKQMVHLNELLGAVVGRERMDYSAQKDVAGLLDDLQQLFKSGLPVEKDSLQRLFSSREFKTLVKDTLERQWTVKPEELTGNDKINRLYEKLDGQMNRMADVLKATGQQSTGFTQMAADIRGNIEFMNQINQMYTYVQLPLKLTGQSANAELYVYTNKKALAQGEQALTAFLHLDMDNLGPTDVSVSLYGKDVTTNFYMENDAAYDLLERYLPQLEERLQKKGYNCRISVTNEAKHVNFVEDFLKKDHPSAGQLHRYSFDMRA